MNVNRVLDHAMANGVQPFFYFGARYKVLVVDDDDSARGLFRLTLKNDFPPDTFAILEAGSVQEARHILKERPDLLCTDWNLPDGDGFEFANEAKSQQPGIYVILCTANSEFK